MRAVLILFVALSLAMAPVASVAATTCAHTPSPAHADTGHHGHAEAGHVDALMQPAHDGAAHDGASGAACDCDPGCADHCDAVTPAAAVLSIASFPVKVVAISVVRAIHRTHLNPPPGTPLRPPQTPIA